MTISKKLNILDVTIRDGSNLIAGSYQPQQMVQIAQALFNNDIKFCEMSHAYGIGTHLLKPEVTSQDNDFLKPLQNFLPNLCVFISPIPEVLSAVQSNISFFNMARIGVNIHELAKAKPFIDLLKKHHKKVSIQLVKSHARDAAFVAHTARRAELMGADIVYLVDTYGSFQPSDVKFYLSKMRDQLQHAELGFHGHNNLGLANENAITAIESGVDWIDASLLGVGRGAGNTQLEVIVEYLQQQKLFTEINLAGLKKSINEIILPIFKQAPQINEIDRLGAIYKIDNTQERNFYKLCDLLNCNLEDIYKILRQDLAMVEVSQSDLARVIKSLGHDPQKILPLL